jgi:hypothetical protein
VKNPEFLVVCFAADYVHALETAQKWFAPTETEFKLALERAGTFVDSFNDEGSSSIVLLSHTTAVILKFRPLSGFSVAHTGCASADTGIEMRKSRSDPGFEFWLPNATLRSTHGHTRRDQSQPSSPPEPAPLLGIFSGKPMSAWDLPTSVWGSPDNSDAPDEGNWFARLAGAAAAR